MLFLCTFSTHQWTSLLLWYLHSTVGNARYFSKWQPRSLKANREICRGLNAHVVPITTTQLLVTGRSVRPNKERRHRFVCCSARRQRQPARPGLFGPARPARTTAARRLLEIAAPFNNACVDSIDLSKRRINNRAL